jgi:hypothetical protein
MRHAPSPSIPEPLRIHLDFDAAMVDEVMARLTAAMCPFRMR